MEPHPLLISFVIINLLIGQILIEEKRLGEAELIYRDLLVRNSENYEYYEKLERCLILRKSCDIHMICFVIACYYSNG